MRIPLDYYRILSVPVKATTKQLERAYSDRLMQQPRREYSQSAIEARQELIKYSYQVLSNLEQRAIYDAQFLINMQPLKTPEPSAEEGESSDSDEEETVDVTPDLATDATTIPLANPTIEISSGQLVGALLILHELGEYETVLELGINYFNERELERSALEIEGVADVSLDTTQEDLILSLALAYLEFGREQWHRQEYENAALSGQMGVELLQQKSLFSHIQEELERDLYRLRPYRILELISQNTGSVARAEGFTLLQSMLLQREGIEGKGQDRSGLNFDQFLCFVQQLRTYLTSAEQQKLFDNESQSNSAIASYLAVYALLGRGFSLKQPELVLRAQRKLEKLGEKQDVNWEQSIAALLLGHTEKAIHKLRNATDFSRLEQVKQHSPLSSDLLPGLCFYGERWLQEDVLAQFCDLSTIKLTLKEYFADPQVQAYLDELAPTALAGTTSTTAVKQNAAQKNQMKNQITSERGIMSLWRNLLSSVKPALAQNKVSAGSIAVSRDSSSVTKTYEANIQAQSESPGVNTATLERNNSAAEVASLQNQHKIVAPHNPYHQNSSSKKTLSLPLQPKTRAVPESVIKKAQGKAGAKSVGRRKKRSPETLWKGWLFILCLILGVGTVGYIAMKLFLSPKVRTANQPAIAISEPAVEIPVKKTEPATVKPKLSFAEQSQQVIQTWLNSKSAAFGKEHQIDQLNKILAEPLLTTWRDRATAYQSENIYREYQHQITMQSAAIDPNDQNKATVEAEVKEVAKHYQSGQLDNAQSYDDNLLVRYQLIRQGGTWLINNAEVLKTL